MFGIIVLSAVRLHCLERRAFTLSRAPRAYIPALRADGVEPCMPCGLVLVISPALCAYMPGAYIPALAMTCVGWFITLA